MAARQQWTRLHNRWATLPFAACPLSGVKRTCFFAAHMSAFDPKRTWVLPMKHCERATALPDRGSGRGSRGIRIERKQFLGVRYAAQSVSSHRNEPTFNVADIGKRR